jgi:hypothetical protein
LAAFGRRTLVYVAPMSLAGIRNPQQQRKSRLHELPNKKPPGGGFSIQIYDVDQAAINAGFDFRRYP